MEQVTAAPRSPWKGVAMCRVLLSGVGLQVITESDTPLLTPLPSASEGVSLKPSSLPATQYGA